MMTSSDRNAFKYFEWVVIFACGAAGVAVHFHRYDWAVALGLWAIVISICAVRMVLEEIRWEYDRKNNEIDRNPVETGES